MSPSFDETAAVAEPASGHPREGAEASPRASAPAAVELQDVDKQFGEISAVSGVNLEIRDGEFFSMLGPSGSGKTTTLRLIAGFETPSHGRILLRGRDVSRLPAFERDVNTVFQDYALFPHMNVQENVAYGLMVRRVPNSERNTRVAEALRSVRLAGFGDRRPAQLSGGQRQRVALARALVNRPKVLLLDEPLGALDRKLREEMQVELKEIQRDVGITFVFVTHDQDEALAMSDRVAVFNAGRVEQVGTPAEIYERPATAFVAEFVGTTNIVEGALARRVLGRDDRVSVRPERIRAATVGAPVGVDECGVTGRVRDIVYLGATTRYVVTTDDGSDLVVTEPNTRASDTFVRRGDEVQLIWRRMHMLRVGGDVVDEERRPAP